MRETHHIRPDSFQVIFKPIIEANGGGTRDVWVYLVFQASYGWTEGKCEGATPMAQIKMNHNYLPNNDLILPGQKDPGFKYEDYTPATIVDLANIYSKDDVDAKFAAINPACMTSSGRNFEGQSSSGACAMVASQSASSNTVRCAPSYHNSHA